MKGVLVDSNIIIDILTEDPAWFSWSSAQLETLFEHHVLYINAIIYAEVSINFNKIEELEQAIPSNFFRRSNIPMEASFLAGKAFLRYKKEKESKKTTTLPDFFIGAHAAVDNLALLTRDGKRFAHYFPTLELISP